MGLKLIEMELFQFMTDLMRMEYRNNTYEMKPATIEKILALLSDFERSVKNGSDRNSKGYSVDNGDYRQVNSELCSKLLTSCSANEFNQIMSSEYKMVDWMQLIHGALSNTQDAVEILNDILNYDKVYVDYKELLRLSNFYDNCALD